MGAASRLAADPSPTPEALPATLRLLTVVRVSPDYAQGPAERLYCLSAVLSLSSL